MDGRTEEAALASSFAAATILAVRRDASSRALMMFIRREIFCSTQPSERVARVSFWPRAIVVL
jgi:hypothetical protein